MSTLCLATSEILDLFAEEIEFRSGRVTDTFDDGRRLFTRSVLPQLDEVRPNDRVQGGVALKATSKEICVYPYVFREVCRNGAVMAQSLQAHRLVLSTDDSSGEVAAEIREAVGACCQPEVFDVFVQEIRTSIDTVADMELTILSYLSQLRKIGSGEILSQVIGRFFGDGDSSRFGLMNAVTSVARDTADPEDRWRLEEMGGGIAAGIVPKPPANAPGIQLEHPAAMALG